MAKQSDLVQLSDRGQLTLPADLRNRLKLKGGDHFMVSMKEGGIVLELVETLPIEFYTEERVAEFAANAEMSEVELNEARKAWGL